MWSAVSLSSLHKQHQPGDNEIKGFRRCNKSCVLSLLRAMSQQKTWTFLGARVFQILSWNMNPWVELSPISEEKEDLTENIPLWSGTQSLLYWIVPCSLTLSTIADKFENSLTSLSVKFLEKPKSHKPILPSQISCSNTRLAIGWFWTEEILYKAGNLKHKGPSTLHASSQNWMVSPDPTFHFTLWKKLSATDWTDFHFPGASECHPSCWTRIPIVWSYAIFPNNKFTP